ncbi:hypothetical protein AB4343_17295 [Vibrio breoganii]|uniref:Uncharacterized protein n=1 Tax=Vibrio breoganii TaxID=553239 RepID=A0ABX1UFD6_9VIBR|nr:hypothetical protein [Vibrio breoganii]NMO75290.1 hypothetical protein [Vibrio breoganii]NMR71827.1 hypothetical protein [Vibrio breoganii]PMF96632.1 hypothetical protein BCV08_10325 [Vibrio breoganii]PMG02684.1 hypothetical protein BCV02_10785 [Vibrio breoganii]PMH22481.1 hypothetical protein BCU74_00140 [Vibrio breoganii]
MNSSINNDELDRYIDEVDLQLTEQQARNLGWYEDSEEIVIRKTTVLWSGFFIFLLAAFSIVLGVLL